MRVRVCVCVCVNYDDFTLCSIVHCYKHKQQLKCLFIFLTGFFFTHLVGSSPMKFKCLNHPLIHRTLFRAHHLKWWTSDACMDVQSDRYSISLPQPALLSGAGRWACWRIPRGAWAGRASGAAAESRILLRESALSSRPLNLCVLNCSIDRQQACTTTKCLSYICSLRSYVCICMYGAVINHTRACAAQVRPLV